MPPTLVNRTPETIAIKDFLAPLKKGEPTCSNLFITGSVGVGKTAVTRFILYNIPNSIPNTYIKVSYHDTAYRLIRRIVESFFPGTEVSGRATSEVLYNFVHRISHKPALVVLDEIDRVPLDTLEPILHTIPRETWITLFLLSRKPAALAGIPEDTKSSLRCRSMVFGCYGEEQLVEILNQRVATALYPDKLEEGVLKVIAKYAGYFGNARLAIDILKTACEEAAEHASGRVTINDAENAIDLVEEKSVISAVKDLPKTHQLVLKIIMERRPPTTFKSVFKRWQKNLAATNLPVFSRWKFYDVVSDLKKLDFIKNEKIGRGRGRGFKYYLHLCDSVEQHQTTLKSYWEKKET